MISIPTPLGFSTEKFTTIHAESFTSPDQFRATDSTRTHVWSGRPYASWHWVTAPLFATSCENTAPANTANTTYATARTRAMMCTGLPQKAFLHTGQLPAWPAPTP